MLACDSLSPAAFNLAPISSSDASAGSPARISPEKCKIGEKFRDSSKFSSNLAHKNFGLKIIGQMRMHAKNKVVKMQFPKKL